jgi:type III secretion protein Q
MTLSDKTRREPLFGNNPRASLFGNEFEDASFDKALEERFEKDATATGLPLSEKDAHAGNSLETIGFNTTMESRSFDPPPGDANHRWSKPRPVRLTRAEARDSRRLYVGRQDLAFSVGSQSLSVTLASPREVVPGVSPVQMGVRIDGHLALLGLSRSLIRPLLGTIGPSLADQHPDLDLLIEAALAEPLNALETILGRTLSLAPAGEKPPPDLRLIGFRVANGDTRLGMATLRLAAADLAVIADALDQLPPQPTRLARLPIGLSIEVGSLRLTLGTLRQLGRGDVLLSDDNYPVGGACIVMEGRRLTGRKVDRGFQIVGTAAGHNEGLTSMDDVQDAPEEQTTLDQLAVRIIFEIGRLELPLGEIQKMQPGYVLELDRPATLAVDLTVRGQTIGKGELVEIDNTLGVRILRLFGHE